MGTRTTPFAPGTPCWVDLMTSDIEGAKDFYGALLDWDYSGAAEEFGGYVTALSDGHGVAGLMPKPPGVQMPDLWTTYLATADIDATVAAIPAAGGQVMRGPDDVGTIGRMAVFLDPAGAGVGLWEAGIHTGFQKYNEPGSVTWDELLSKDFAAAKTFYETVFGWTYAVVGDTDEMRYYVAQVDGQDVAGFMDAARVLPDVVPSHWAVYFSVPSVDAGRAKAVELGATVIQEPMDTPYGRMCFLIDPTGAAFNLHQPPAEPPPPAAPLA